MSRLNATAHFSLYSPPTLSFLTSMTLDAVIMRLGVAPVRLSGGTGAPAHGAPKPRVEDVLALYVLLHVAELARGVGAVSAR